MIHPLGLTIRKRRSKLSLDEGNWLISWAVEYALAKDSDQNKSAPDTGLFETLVGDQPTLIMLDEIARHLRAALAVPTATRKSNLADQTVAFLMSLLEFAASKERCLVVLTLAGATMRLPKKQKYCVENWPRH